MYGHLFQSRHLLALSPSKSPAPDFQCTNSYHIINKLYLVVLLHLLLYLCLFAHGWKPQEMACRVVGESACYEWPSYIRGYQEYKSVWLPTVEETLRLTTKLTIPQDPFTMAVMKDSCIVVGSLTQSEDSPPNCLLFPREWWERQLLWSNWSMVNCAAGFGLEILYVYRFYGRLAYIERLKNILQ